MGKLQTSRNFKRKPTDTQQRPVDKTGSSVNQYLSEKTEEISGH